MPSSATPRLRLEKQFTGENINVWGDHLNTNFELIDKAICGQVTIALTANLALSTANWSEDQARYAVLKFTGTGPYSITLPAVEKSYKIRNACSAALTFTTGAGATVTVDAGAVVNLFCDGSDVVADGFGGLGLKEYIDSVVVGGGATLPSVVSNSGKWLTNNGSAALWAYPTTSDLSDISTYTATRTGEAIAFAVAL